MRINQFARYCFAMIFTVVALPAMAGVANATGFAEIYLSDDNWTIDKGSMQVIVISNCKAKVGYEHSGDTKTIGSCTYTGNPDKDVRGDFYYSFSAKVLYRNDNTKGFLLSEPKADCHYQLQQAPYSYYYAVTCKVITNPTIQPFGGACAKAASVTAQGGQDGVMLVPVCTD